MPILTSDNDMKAKCKQLWQWLRKNVFNKEMLLWVIIAELIFWSPCIVTGFLALCVNKWWWTAFGAIVVFWSGPFTPAVPLQIALALGLKKLYAVVKNRKSKKHRVPETDAENTTVGQPNDSEIQPDVPLLVGDTQTDDSAKEKNTRTEPALKSDDAERNGDKQDSKDENGTTENKDR